MSITGAHMNLDTIDLISIRELGDSLDDIMDGLKYNEIAVLRARFYNKLTLKATGHIMGLSPARVRQIQSKALRKMRHPHRLKWLYAHMEGIRDAS